MPPLASTFVRLILMPVFVPDKQRIRSRIHPSPQTDMHKKPPGRHYVGQPLVKYVVRYNQTAILLDSTVCSGYNKQEQKYRKKGSALHPANAFVPQVRIWVLRMRLPYLQARRSLPALQGKDEGRKICSGPGGTK